jgi:hypothetical protein
MNTTDFITKAKLLHGDKYDYAQTIYSGSHSRLIISCKEHGNFSLDATKHLSGRGCQICGIQGKKVLRCSTDQFIEKAVLIHGNTFDYSKVDYVDAHKKVIIICLRHGEFQQSPSSHLAGSGCRGCAQESLNIRFRKSTDSFICEAMKKHGDKYDYKLVNYVNNRVKVAIICPMHGVFKQSPFNHLVSGCSKCAHSNTSVRCKRSLQSFIDKASMVHSGKYDYSQVVYKTKEDKILIGCSDHGFFSQRAGSHLRGAKCPTCDSENRYKLRWSNVANEFLDKAKNIHGDRYCYSRVNYVDAYTKVEIKCLLHDKVFLQTPMSHLRGSTSCKQCSQTESLGERAIRVFLRTNNIPFETEKTFVSCRMKKNSYLRFDFCLSDSKILIEYDGLQHFSDIGLFWNNNSFKDIVKRDVFKNKWAEDNGYRLLRIGYLDRKNIPEILSRELLCHT